MSWDWFRWRSANRLQNMSGVILRIGLSRIFIYTIIYPPNLTPPPKKILSPNLPTYHSPTGPTNHSPRLWDLRLWKLHAPEKKTRRRSSRQNRRLVSPRWWPPLMACEEWWIFGVFFFKVTFLFLVANKNPNKIPWFSFNVCWVEPWLIRSFFFIIPIPMVVSTFVRWVNQDIRNPHLLVATIIFVKLPMCSLKEWSCPNSRQIFGEIKNIILKNM